MTGVYASPEEGSVLEQLARERQGPPTDVVCGRCGYVLLKLRFCACKAYNFASRQRWGLGRF
jgi:hypothetical protein